MPLINLKEKKRELRARYKKLRAECPPELKKSLDRRLTEKFFMLEEYGNCETLFAFMSSPIECGTSEIIQRALADGKKVAIPKCRDNMGNMDFYYITSTQNIKKGAFSIMEPDTEKCESVGEYSNGLCIVPGLCFDLLGYRIGFGKGYYDRFLEKFKGVTVGICYSKYVLNELPRGIYDKSVDILVTEKFINHTHNVF